MDDVTRLGRCARCGSALMPTSLDDLCSNCAAVVGDAQTLLGSSSGSAPDAPTIAGASSSTSEHPTVLAFGDGPVAESGPPPEPGERYGPYRIDRLLGRGGMGDVYEAEEVEHGRRVALKVLGRRLLSADDRARFLREGELAAAITHPHTVYIYGSEEITGSPVITMELLPGGTLKDLVARRGPLHAKEAVDLILQVAAGLEAAASAGILHRDIKPANCFIDRDGSVKVGDFGLSIASAGRESAASGFFQGTPQFAAPEQIRGEALDIRADIYAVGATLFFLLTGQPPFDDPDLTTLVTRVKEERPREPRAMREDVPAELSAVVTRTLSKPREARPSTYAELRELLLPFSSAAAQPAPLGRRFVAGLIDQATTSFLISGPLVVAFTVLQQRNPNLRIWTSAIQILTAVLYYAVAEGRFGAGLGKYVMRLQVVSAAGVPPGVARGAVRGLMQEAAAILLTIPAIVVGGAAFTRYALGHPLVAVGGSSGTLAIQMAVYFISARRRNGFAALHDLLTGSRVARRKVRAVDVEAGVENTSPAGVASTRRFGIFDGARTIAPLEGGLVWWSAEDPRLRRPVWILERRGGAPPLDAAVRDRNRQTRLRWLGGRRSDVEAWDAFQAFDGASLVGLSPRPWRVVRQWIGDLADEVDAGLPDGSLPPLTIDRVWITARGRAKVLDFPVTPASGAAASVEAAATLASSQRWLADVATRGLGGEVPVDLSLSARTFLNRLTSAGFTTTADILQTARGVTTGTDNVEPWRRASAMLATGLTPLIFFLLGILAAFVIRQAPITLQGLGPDLKRDAALQNAVTPEQIAERNALETFIAASYDRPIASELTWNSSTNGIQLKDYRLLAMDIVARHPQVTPEELAKAKAILGHSIDSDEAQLKQAGRMSSVAYGVVPALMLLVGFGLAGSWAFGVAVMFRGGVVLRALRLAIVDRKGRQISRWRSGIRASVAWLPVAAFLVGVAAAGFKFDGTYHVQRPFVAAGAIGCLVVFLAGAALAAVRRSVQDRVVGTWIVPR